MHPDRYLRVDAPKPVPIRLDGMLGRGYERTARGTLGELQTRELLAEAGGGGSSEAAAGWGGDRYELWQPRGLEDCAAPCRVADVLVMRWVWDTAVDAREFERKLRQWIADGLGASREAGSGVWRLDESAVAVARRGGAVTLALAPDRVVARRAAAAR
jgi:hypothetical protein